ncbi:uncharacterized protein TNCV_1963921 [Trichonephila clavipes]|nr:uncharacterized protein TNCV_1963921 [Trichonephila clavipes]
MALFPSTCNPDIRDVLSLTPIEVLKNTKRRKIPVQYSLNFGNPVEVTQILQIQVAEETNFLDIMRLAQEINPKYRFLLDDMQEIPVVYSIGDIPNDAEKGMFWMLHVASANNRPRSDVGRLVPYLGNPFSLLIEAIFETRFIVENNSTPVEEDTKDADEDNEDIQYHHWIEDEL